MFKAWKPKGNGNGKQIMENMNLSCLQCCRGMKLVLRNARTTHAGMCWALDNFSPSLSIPTTISCQSTIIFYFWFNFALEHYSISLLAIHLRNFVNCTGVYSISLSPFVW